MPGAGAGRLQHFEIEQRALLEPLRLQQAAVRVQEVEPLLQLLLDRLGRLQQRRPRRDVMAVGVDFDEFEILRLLPGQRIELGDRFDLVAEEADPPARDPRSGRETVRSCRRARGKRRGRNRRASACIAARRGRR